jgi:hypothetical protein
MYQYTWTSGWTTKASANIWDSNEALQNDLKNGHKKAMIQEITKKFAELGKWLKIDSVNVNIQSFRRPMPSYVEAEGTTTIIFESDATPEQEFSPQGWEEILWAILGLIETAITLHGTLFFILLIIIAVTLFVIAGGFKGVLFGAGAGGLGDVGTIIAIGIIGIGGLLVLSSFLGKEKRKGRRH